MEQQDKIKLLLSMQEHPENYSDEQLIQMLTEDDELAGLMEQLALMKRAFVKRETNHEDLPINEYWQQFATDHAGEIDDVESIQGHHATKFSILGSQMWKVAAMFIGILFTMGIAYAAIHIVRNINRPMSSIVKMEQTIPTAPKTILPRDTIAKDSAVVLQPIVFDNVPLEKMLPEMAAYYQVDVDFQDDNARQLRFYFVWKHEETLEQVLHRLNRFESIDVRLDGNKVIVE